MFLVTVMPKTGPAQKNPD